MSPAAPAQPLVEELFSDYKLVDGVQIAFTAQSASGGQAGPRAPRQRHQDQRAARSRAVQTPRHLEPAPAAVVRRAVRRSLRGRAHARAAHARARHRRSRASAGPHFAAAGGQLIADYRGVAVTGLTEPLAKIPQSLADCSASLVKSRARRAARRAGRHRFPGFQFPARATRQEARHSGRVLHRPADLGLAARTAEDHPRGCRPRAGDFSVRGSDLPERRRAGRVRGPSAGGSRASRRRRAKPFCRGSG